MTETLSEIFTPFLLALLTSTGIGLIIGIEREFSAVSENESDHFAGIRTFPLVAVLGCVITCISQARSEWLLVAAVAAFILFVGVAYYANSRTGGKGLTTEISLILTFALGAMAALQFIKEALAVAVVATTLLSLKGKFHTIISKVTEEEIFAFIKFIILCMLLFPFLPNEGYGPNDLLNPRDIGLIIVVVSSLSLIGYLLIKFAGANRGILLTALFGGMISSTAVTWMFSSRSKESDATYSNLYAAGISLASAVMFLRVALITFIFNKELFLMLLVPCLLMAATEAGFIYFLARGKVRSPSAKPLELGNPINILNALGFGLLYVGITFLVFYSNEYLGSRGLIMSGLISGLADVDAITISMSKFALAASKNDISFVVIVLAMISNTMVKIAIAFLNGNGVIRKKASLALASAILVGGVYLLIHRLVL